MLVSPADRKGNSAACLKVWVNKVEEFGEDLDLGPALIIFISFTK